VTAQSTFSDDEFAREIIRVHGLDSSAAESRWWELYHAARNEGRDAQARGCLLQLGLLLSSMGRERDSLRVMIRMARESKQLSASVFTNLGCSLERNKWYGFAHLFFLHALKCPAAESSLVKWHELARIGLERTKMRRMTRETGR